MAEYFNYNISVKTHFNHYISIIISAVISISMLSSCDNSDDIGNLLGQWKLDEMTYNGVTTHPNSLYMRFQSQYVQTYYVNMSECVGHYLKSNGTMTMKFYYSNGEDSVAYPTDPHNAAKDLVPYNFYDNGTERTAEDIKNGIYPVNLSFKIDTYTSNTLILSNDSGRWVFIKW